jgi:hypothetical protein
VSGACPLATCPARDGGVSSFQGVCPGASPPLAGYPVCRSSADCVGVSFCAEQPVGGCGVCVGVEHACTTDSDCLPVGAMVCEPYVETSPCLCNGASNGTRCVPKCPGNACDADSQCSATGHCLPTPCSQGYTCPSDLACKPGDASADVHGCGTKLCTEGFTCAADQTCDQSAPQADVHRCAPAPCSSGYACPTGWRCAAGTGSDAHGCTPIPCSMGAPCGVNESCDPTRPGRGCVVRNCVRDNDCDCGACVNGSCEPSLWICVTAPS